MKKEKALRINDDEIIEAIKIICRTLVKHDVSEAAGFAAMMSMIETRRMQGKLPSMVFKNGEKG